MIVTTSLLIEVGFRISDAKIYKYQIWAQILYWITIHLLYYIPPNLDLRCKCQSDKILIPISKDPHLMDEDSNPTPSFQIWT